MDQPITNNGASRKEAKAMFAGGCFWCMVSPFEEMPGIISVVSGYTGGHTVNPTYQEVCSETTGHAEAVQITYDPAIFPYEKLLDIFGSKSTLRMQAVSSMIAGNLIGQVFIIMMKSSENWRKLLDKSLKLAVASTGQS